MKTLLYTILPVAIAIMSTSSAVGAQTAVAIEGAESVAVDFAAKRKVKQRRARYRAEIACTVAGCIPVPSGCHQVPGKTWDGEPTGFDVILCP